MPSPPNSLDEFELLPGVRDAVDRLKSAGYVLVVVTNQPDIARGTQSVSLVDAHERGGPTRARSRRDSRLSPR